MAVYKYFVGRGGSLLLAVLIGHQHRACLAKVRCTIDVINVMTGGTTKAWDII